MVKRNRPFNFTQTSQLEKLKVDLANEVCTGEIQISESNRKPAKPDLIPAEREDEVQIEGKTDNDFEKVKMSYTYINGSSGQNSTNQNSSANSPLLLSTKNLGSKESKKPLKRGK